VATLIPPEPRLAYDPPMSNEARPFPMIDQRGQTVATRAAERAATRIATEALQRIGAEEFAARGVALRRRAGLLSPMQPTGGLAGFYDPMPVPMAAAAFSGLARSIVARAWACEALIETAYTSGALSALAVPPEPLFRAANFIRPMVTGPLAAPRLGFYAIDLIRDPAGGYAMLRDHCAAPAGLGHAVMLRRLTAEMMPEMRAAVTLASQNPLIERLREDLHALAGGRPMAVLTDGQGDLADIHFLARLMGALVLRPGDLAMIGDAMQVKTLAGGQPLRLMVRCIGDAGIDPLEQGGSPDHGIAGLFSALRRDRAVMLNAPGAGLAETLARFLPDSADLPMSDGAVCDTVARYRFFAVRLASGWEVLPGGLKLSRDQAGAAVMQDIWVIEAGDASPSSVAPPHTAPQAPAQSRSRSDLPSRIAEALFWLGRMVERLDQAQRLLTVAMVHFADVSGLAHEATERDLLTELLVSAKLLPQEWSGSLRPASALRQALARHRPLSALVQEVTRLVAVAAERFSPRMLRTVEATLAAARDALAADDDDERAWPILARAMASFGGVMAEDAAGGGAFLFVEIGRRLERGITIADMLAQLMAGKPSRRDLGIALAVELADARLSYETEYGGAIAPDAALQLLLNAGDHPRSLAFQTQALQRAFAVLEPACPFAHDIAPEPFDAGAGAAMLIGSLRGRAEALRQLSNRMMRDLFAPRPAGHQLGQSNQDRSR
jgi:uncharacterized alpha-E superfamily protein